MLLLQLAAEDKECRFSGAASSSGRASPSPRGGSGSGSGSLTARSGGGSGRSGLTVGSGGGAGGDKSWESEADQALGT